MTSGIIRSLQQTKKSVDDHGTYPDQPRVYGFFLKPDAHLSEFGKSGQLLYIGIAKDSLRKRDLHQHFRSGATGSSTLRRSIGAILREPLGMQPISRNFSDDPKRFDHYKFTPGGKEKLSVWIKQQLHVGYWIDDERMNYSLFRDYEEEVIKELHPTLDLDSRTKRYNPLGAHLCDLREICKLAAERYSKSIKG